MGHVSTGGGACLNFLAGRSMPALAGLAQSAMQFDVEIIMHEVQ